MYVYACLCVWVSPERLYVYKIRLKPLATCEMYEIFAATQQPSHTHTHTHTHRCICGDKASDNATSHTQKYTKENIYILNIDFYNIIGLQKQRKI